MTELQMKQQAQQKEKGFGKGSENVYLCGYSMKEEGDPLRWMEEFQANDKGACGVTMRAWIQDRPERYEKLASKVCDSVGARRVCDPIHLSCRGIFAS